MIYNKKTLQKDLNFLLGDHIANVHYFPENSEHLYKPCDNIVEALDYGFFLETSSGNIYGIDYEDYFPNSSFEGNGLYALEGLDLFRTDSIEGFNKGISQLNENFWNNFREQTIIGIEIIERDYLINRLGKILDYKFTVPLGVKLIFENNKECYILNAAINGFMEQKNLYESQRGGGFLLISRKSTFNKCQNLTENPAYIDIYI